MLSTGNLSRQRGVAKMPRGYDVIICGGGVNGCSVACFLGGNPSFSGTIAVVERDPTYEHAPSARATGGIRQQFSTPENIRIGLFGAHFIKRIGEYLGIDGEVPDVGFREQGYLILSRPDCAAVLSENVTVQHAEGAAIALLDQSALATRFPWLETNGLSCGAFGEHDEGWLDPYSLLQAYRAKAHHLGVTFLREEVSAFERSGQRLSGIRLASGARITADVVVNAAGASGARALAASAGGEIPIESRKRCTYVFQCPDGPRGAPLTIFPEGLAFRPEGDRFLANLAPPPEADPECYDHDIDYDAFESRIWPLLAERVPAFERLRSTGAWCCHYDLNTFDENAIVGPAPGPDGPLENAYIVCGFSGHGLQQSPAMGRATAELILYGEYRSLDLSRMEYQRIARNEPLRERNCY